MLKSEKKSIFSHYFQIFFEELSKTYKSLCRLISSLGGWILIGGGKLRFRQEKRKLLRHFDEFSSQFLPQKSLFGRNRHSFPTQNTLTALVFLRHL